MTADGLRRIVGLLLASASGILGAWMAVCHPLAPGLALSLWTAWLLVAMRWPNAWLVLLPAALPVLGLAPWTGWFAGEEFDMLVLAALAAGHARLALWPAPAPADAAQARQWRRVKLLAVGLGLWLLLGLALGWADARTPKTLPEIYTTLPNTWRVAKSTVFALLALPLMRAALLASSVRAQRLLGKGVVAGLVLMAGAVLWERAAFPGLLNFADNYRTTGLFWEMHVGGAAIDAFLALSMPFAVWALVLARRPLAWLGGAILIQVLAYVCLTTFARGVYGAVLGGLVVAGVLAWRQRQGLQVPHPRWRVRANRILRVALVLEVAAMTLASSFLMGRLADLDNDFGSRWAHWTRGLSALHSPADWVFGLGLGRLPAHYAALGRAGEFPGAAVVVSEQAGQAPQHFLRLYGPPTRLQLAGRYALSQQVQAVPGLRYQIAMDLRAAQDTRVRVLVCERHLLYAADCQYRELIRQGQSDASWQHVAVDLFGPSITGGSVLAPRLVTVSLAVSWPGTSIDIDNVQVSAGKQRDLVTNGSFESGLAHWFPAVRSYFLPWHIDNLVLETLIERGIVGLLLFGALMAMALWHLAFGVARALPMAPYLAASLASGCALGLVSSIMDNPRMAFLFVALALWSLHLAPPAAGPERSPPPPPG